MKLVSMMKLNKFNGTPKTVSGSMESLGDEDARFISDQLQKAYRNGRLIAQFNGTPECVERLEKVVLEFNRSTPCHYMSIEYYYAKVWDTKPTFCIYIYEV